MRVIVFGATGMVGQGALRECLLDPRVTEVRAPVRRPTGEQHPKLREIVHGDFTNMDPLGPHLEGLDACLFCLGVSSAGMSEADYTKVTYDTAMAAAQALLAKSPGITFLFVSGNGTDSTEKGSTMWARVKGKTENALLAMPFKAAFMLRPGYIQPLHGVRSSTGWLRTVYAVLGPLYPLWRALFPRYVTTTEDLGRVMVELGASGAGKAVLENADIVAKARTLEPPSPSVATG